MRSGGDFMGSLVFTINRSISKISNFDCTLPFQNIKILTSHAKAFMDCG